MRDKCTLLFPCEWEQDWHAEACNGECTNRCERLWQVRELDEDAEVLGL